jgi:type IV pilus assembly protein PilE
MRRNRGFTLLELLVVVAIVAILAAIAIPSYVEYTRKGKRSDGVSAIGEVQLRQERYRADNPTYGTMAQLFGAGLTTFNNSHKYYSLAVSNITGNSYTITATRRSDLANDPKCGNLVMTVSAGTATKSLSPANATKTDYCWRQ